jgi:hypothetical protein
MDRFSLPLFVEGLLFLYVCLPSSCLLAFISPYLSACVSACLTDSLDLPRLCLLFISDKKGRMHNFYDAHMHACMRVCFCSAHLYPVIIRHSRSEVPGHVGGVVVARGEAL